MLAVKDIEMEEKDEEEKPKSNPQNILHAIPQALNFWSLRIIHYYLIFNFFPSPLIFLCQKEESRVPDFFKLNYSTKFNAFNQIFASNTAWPDESLISGSI
jgi:hypothetical protein